MPSDDITNPRQGTRVGERIHDRYRVLRFIGAGGMGEIYEAEHLQVGKRVAIKFLFQSFSNDREALERFEREARVASLANSPHLVDVLDAGILPDGTRYIVLELLRGATLAAELATVGTMSGERACDIIRQLATGLHAAHAAGITHRDLKPENVFLTPNPDGTEHVKILDFGVSKYHRTDLGLQVTRTGAAIGTPTYMAPEQAEGSRDVDARADIWSLGVLLYRMLTGELPFRGDNYARLLIEIATASTPKVRDLRLDVPVKLDAIVSRCLEKAPANRFASTTELLAALDELVEGQPDTVRLGQPRLPLASTASEVPEPEPSTSSETRRVRGYPPSAPAPAPAERARETDTLPFDEIILTEGNGRRVLPARAFFELALSERIRHVIARTVVFLLRGVEVDRQEALAKLRERRAAATA